MPQSSLGIGAALGIGSIAFLLVGAGTAAIKFSTDYETAMAKVAGLTDSTAGEMKVLNSSVLELTKTQGGSLLWSLVIGVMGQMAAQLARLQGMSPGQVLTLGADENPGAIGNAVLTTSQNDSGFNTNLSRNLPPRS